MAHFLNASQLAEDCQALGLEHEENVLIAASDLAAASIARVRGVQVTHRASNQPGFAGLCVGFGPAHDGQKCPEEFVEFDKGSDWAEESERERRRESYVEEKGWKFGGDAPGFWFHEPTWGSWKSAASWAGTEEQPSGADAKPAIYATIDELCEGEKI